MAVASGVQFLSLLDRVSAVMKLWIASGDLTT